MLTDQSLGRVIDADFATETNLSKQQILNQAVMLAQANQSKRCLGRAISNFHDCLMT